MAGADARGAACGHGARPAAAENAGAVAGTAELTAERTTKYTNYTKKDQKIGLVQTWVTRRQIEHRRIDV